MALIKCKECGHEMSDKASVCPHCGCPIETEDKLINRRTKLWALLVLLLCLIVGGGYAYTKFFNRSVNPASEENDRDDFVELSPEFVKSIEKYDRLGIFSEGYAAVCKNGKWGYINTKGEEVIPISIEAKCVGRFSEGLAVVMCGGEDFKVINTAGESLFSLKIINRGYDMQLQESSELPYYINGKLYVPLYDENGNIGFSIYDKNGSKVGTAEEKDGFEFYKQNETGDYITFFKEEDSGIQLWGIKDANGNVIIEPQYDAILTMFHRWYGDNNIKTKISNGVALVVMNEVSWDNMGSGGSNHYGYVDLKGNETLSEATKATCKTSHEIINEVTDEYFDEDEGDDAADYDDSSYASTSSGGERIVTIYMTGEKNMDTYSSLDGNFGIHNYSNAEDRLWTDAISVPQGKVWVFKDCKKTASSRNGIAFTAGFLEERDASYIIRYGNNNSVFDAPTWKSLSNMNGERFYGGKVIRLECELGRAFDGPISFNLEVNFVEKDD